LGNGEVTPDKYYCESCRPENHPYRVLDGQLISSSKRAIHTLSTISSNPKSKSSKKRSTMNSKDSSHLTELDSTEQSNDDHSYETRMVHKSGKGADDHNISSHGRASKRRKKTDSNMDEDGFVHENIDNNHNGPDSEGEESYIPPENGPDSYTNSANISLKTLGKNKISRSSKSKKTKTLSNHSLPGSPRDSNDESSESLDGQAAATSTSSSPQQHVGRKANGKKGGRSAENDTSIDKTTPSTKRVKLDKLEIPHSEGSLPATDHNDDSNQVFKKESSMEPSNTAVPSDSTSHLTVKRTGSRRSHIHAACPDTPTPTGTPQPMLPAPPAKVKYPSSRMSLKDMSKRAQQLLEYINRVQVEMTELKNKRSQKSPISTEGDIISLTRSQGLTVDTEMQLLKTGSTNTESKGLSTPPQSVHELSNGDGSEQISGTISKQIMDQADISRPDEEKGAPITPPHQPMIANHTSSEPGDDTSKSHTNHTEIEGPVLEVTSLDLIDKLTSDLIHFQERFGRHGE
ncbi:hypothetical protein BGZ46_002427, partial [Entomortierella lignicola]